MAGQAEGVVSTGLRQVTVRRGHLGDGTATSLDLGCSEEELLRLRAL